MTNFLFCVFGVLTVQNYICVIHHLKALILLYNIEPKNVKNNGQVRLLEAKFEMTKISGDGFCK